MGDLKSILTIEMVVMIVMLLAIVLLAIIILLKMKPFKDFSEVKIGKLELKRGKEEIEHDKQQDEVLGKLLGLADSMRARLDEMDKRLDDMEKRQDIQYEYTRKAVVAAHQGVVWSGKGAPPLEAIRAGLLLAMLGQNGNLVERMQECIMDRGKGGVKDYNNELNQFINDKSNKDNLTPHFWNVIEEIKKGIH